MSPREKTESFWGLTPLGQMSPAERQEFYDILVDDEPEEQLFFGDSTSHLYENPRLEIAILEKDGSLHPAQGYSSTASLANTRVDVFLERFFAAAMPGNNYDLQLAITSRHRFPDRPEPDRVAHTLTVKGVLNDYANYLTEPVFQGLAIADLLTLDIAVNFLSDKNTRHLLGLLDHEVLSKGIKLAGTFNPVFGTLATYAQGFVKMCLEQKKNICITDAHLTLAANPGPLSASLVEGTYLLLQPTTAEESMSMGNARYDFKDKSLWVADQKVSRNHLFLRITRSA